MLLTISKLSRSLLILTSISLVVSIFVPIWRIELDAPQYPEGLMMQIHANKLGGQVDIINGLNHYIGMQTLHAENFIEFTVLPYIIGFFALLTLASAIIGRKKLLYFTFWAFVIFGIVAMADFWRWEYNYGHNLDPSAAIIVPGMSYQPPLIGFKQLLNFGAYSIPDIGGWLFISGGVFMLIAVLIEIGLVQKIFERKTAQLIIILFSVSIVLESCKSGDPEAIKLNSDKCDNCSMTISDGRFGAEIITKKGRVYKFDDLQCLLDYKLEKSNINFTDFYVNDYTASNKLIDAQKAFYVQHEDVRSPMGGNYCAFEQDTSAINFSKKYHVIIKMWNELSD
jgi:copper chaperone NosL